MKKKIIVATVLSAVLIGGASLTIYANNDGYELYKDALKNTHTLSSATTNIEASVTDNGTLINEVQMGAQYNLQQEIMHSKVEMVTNGQKEAFDIAYQEEGVIIKNLEQSSYYLLKDNQSKAEKKETFEAHHNPELLRIMEHVFDALTVQVHDDIKITNKVEGQKEITVDMSNGDIPIVFREIGQYIVKKGTSVHENATMEAAEYPFLSQDLTVNMPALVSDIEIAKVKVNSQLTNDEIIKHQTMYVNITGKDKAGTKHELELQFNMDYTNINSTNLTPVEIDDSKTEIMDTSKLKDAHHF